MITPLLITPPQAPSTLYCTCDWKLDSTLSPEQEGFRVIDDFEGSNEGGVNLFWGVYGLGSRLVKAIGKQRCVVAWYVVIKVGRRYLGQVDNEI
jgi:hypothetical protein